MSERERWTVYPLLMLAIGLALRNGIVLDELQHNGVVRCKGLEIFGEDGKKKAELNTNASGASLTLFDHERHKYVLVGHEGQVIGMVAGFVGNKQFVPLAIVPIVRMLDDKVTPSEKPETEPQPEPETK
jgi:hypothetical protein